MSSPIDQQKRIQMAGVDAPNEVHGGSVVTRDQLIARQTQAAQAQAAQDAENRRLQDQTRARRRSSGGNRSAPKVDRDTAEYNAIFGAYRQAKAEGAKQGVDVSSATIIIDSSTGTGKVKHVKGTPTQEAKDKADKALSNKIIDQEIADLKASGANVNGAKITVTGTPTGGKKVTIKGVTYNEPTPRYEYANQTYNLKFGSERIGDIVKHEADKGDQGLYGSRQVYDKKDVDAFISDYASYQTQKTYYDQISKGLPAIDASPDVARHQAVGFSGNKIILPQAERIDPFGNVSKAPRFTFTFEKQQAPKDLVKDAPARTGGMFGDLIDFGKGAGAQGTNYARDFVNMFGDPFSKAVFNVKAGKEFAPTPETDIITLGTKDLFNFRGQNGKVLVPDNGVRATDYQKIYDNLAKNPAYGAGAISVTALAFLPKKAYEGIQLAGKGLGLIADTSRTDKLAAEATAHAQHLKKLDAGYASDRARFGRANIDPLHDTSAVGITRLAKADPIAVIIGGGSVKTPTAFNTLYKENNFGIKPDLSESITIDASFNSKGTIKTLANSDLFTGRRTTGFGIKPDLFEGESIKSFVGVPEGGYIRPTLESDVLVRRSTGKGGSGSGKPFNFGGGSGTGIKSVGDTFKEIRTSNGLILLAKQESQQDTLKAETLSLFEPQKTKTKTIKRINPSLSERSDLGFGSGQDLIKLTKRRQAVQQISGAGSFNFGGQTVDQINRQIQQALQGTQTTSKRKGKYRTAQAQRLDQLFDLSQVSKQSSRQAQKSKSVQGLLPRSMLASVQGLQFKMVTRQAQRQAFKQDFKFKTDQTFKFDFTFDRTFTIPNVPVPKPTPDRPPRFPKLPLAFAGVYKRSGGRRKRGVKDYMQEFNVKDLVSVAAGNDSKFAKAFNKQFKDWF